MENENADTANNIIPENGILFEDASMVVIAKPPGVMVHEDGRSHGATVVDWLLAREPKARGVGEPGYAQNGVPLERSGVVHRLDRDTSGVLVLAKNQEAFESLKQQFHEHTVRKEYRTYVYGTFRESWGTIDRPIGRSTKDFRLRSAQRGARGTLRRAVTDWECIAQSKTHAYLKVVPKTGRTHQIRVHLKAIDRPIVADPLYAPESMRAGDSLGFTRLALHAYAITLRMLDGSERQFTAPLPPDFEHAYNAIAAG